MGVSALDDAEIVPVEVREAWRAWLAARASRIATIAQAAAEGRRARG